MKHRPDHKLISIAWTAVWCSCLIAFGNILTNEPEVYGLLLLSSTFEIPPEYLVVIYIPAFVLAGWIGGLIVCNGIFWGLFRIGGLFAGRKKIIPAEVPYHVESGIDDGSAAETGSKSKEKPSDSPITLGQPMNTAGADGPSKADAADEPADERAAVQVDAVDIQLQETVFSDASVSKREMIRRELQRVVGKNKGMEKIYSDSRWNPLMIQAARIGNAFGYGKLHMAYINREEQGQCMVIFDRKDKNTVISMQRDTLSDRIIDTLG